MTNTTKWDKRFLRLAEHVSLWSKDPSTKCSAVITDNNNRIVSIGYNGFPRNITDKPSDYNKRDIKYEKVIHAEVNAIVMAKRNLEKYTIYIWPLMPCSKCASLIIQSGISAVVFPYQDDKKVIARWQNSYDIAMDMFNEAKVQLRCIDL